ncbi:MAG: hypothetical protein ACREBJ_12430 [Nitrosotalea sp.]
MPSAEGDLEKIGYIGLTLMTGEIEKRWIDKERWKGIEMNIENDKAFASLGLSKE